MARVKRGKIAHRRRKRLLSHTKGFRWGRKSKFRLAKEAIFHAWSNAYKDRKRKKREFRRIWQVQLNAACRNMGISYGKFIHGLKIKKIGLDRKVLSQLAREYPQTFAKIVEQTKAQ